MDSRHNLWNRDSVGWKRRSQKVIRYLDSGDTSTETRPEGIMVYGNQKEDGDQKVSVRKDFRGKVTTKENE